MLIIIILSAGVSLLFVWDSGAGTGRTAVIRSLKGETVVLDLTHPRTITVEGLLGTTSISVEDGSVRFIDSPCPHRLCIKKGPVSRAGDLVACLPNGVIARIEGESAYDGITP